MWNNAPQEPTWSFSRAELMKKCLRAYYIRYYLSWGGWKNDAPARVRDAWLLSKLDNRWTWTGKVVHQVIAKWFSDRVLIDKIDPAKIAEKFVENLRWDFKLSRAGKYRSSPGKIVGLMEHEYGDEVSREEWTKVVDAARDCLLNFFTNSAFGFLREAEDILCVEKLESYEVIPGNNAFVVVDLAYRKEDLLVVIDWKTGKKRQDEVERQLVNYGLYFSRKHDWNIANVGCAAVYLKSGDIVRVEIDEDKVNRLVDDIVKDLARMRRLHGLPEDEYPAQPNHLCGWCQYRRLCKVRGN